jgi:ubiquinone/menaquinone biosynthesis C-methylase UbiE
MAKWQRGTALNDPRYRMQWVKPYAGLPEPHLADVGSGDLYAPSTTWDPVWEKIFQERDWGKYPPEHVIRFIARNFGRATVRKNIRLLEIGCGPGANVWFMAREGFSVSGIDGSSTAIQLARKRLAAEGFSADLWVGNFASLPWADHSFDAVVENVSLCTNPWTSIQRALREVLRVLKPGASSLFSFFTDRTWGYGLGDMIESDGFINLREGPLAEKGFHLFLKRARVSELFGEFSDINVERISHTLDNGQHLIELWVISCCKPKQ